MSDQDVTGFLAILPWWNPWVDSACALAHANLQSAYRSIYEVCIKVLCMKYMYEVPAWARAFCSLFNQLSISTIWNSFCLCYKSAREGGTLSTMQAAMAKSISHHKVRPSSPLLACPAALHALPQKEKNTHTQPTSMKSKIQYTNILESR